MKLSILFFCLTAIFLFPSCDNDQLHKTENSDFSSKTLFEAISKEHAGEEEKEFCFKLIFPITVVMPDGSSFTGGEDELLKNMKVWYATHPGSKEKAELKYPVDILWESADIETIAGEAAMLAAKKQCSVGKDACFEFAYPISFTMPDDSTIPVNHNDDWDAFKEWYTAHPNEKDEVMLNYPVDIILTDGSLQTIENDEAMTEAKKDC